MNGTEKILKTGLLYDERYLDHDTGARFAENSRRLTETMSHLEEQEWFTDLKQFTPRFAEREWLESVHGPGYIDHAREVCESGASRLDDPDVSICKKSFEVATLAAGGALEVIDRVMKGEIVNGFALLRPPGHHAESTQAMGFCIFNNVAVGARYLQRHHGVDKVLILDWDVHHGNGTQHLFEDDASVLFASLHQYPFYPGTGAYSETGIGAGRNATVNCPMPAGSADSDYERAFIERILPSIARFKPDAILLSAGFDAHQSDPLGQIELSTEFYGWMSERIMEVADQYAGGRIISLLEGGYNLQYLPLCVARHLEVLMKTSG